MRKALFGAIVCIALAGCAAGAGVTAPEVTAQSSNIVAAIGDARRPEADRARDELRHPADILAFTQVRPGMRVADVGPGGGYYSRLFAVAVGDAGSVFAADWPGRGDRPRPMVAISAEYPNITHSTAGYANWDAGRPLDVIFISQIYHDFYLPFFAVDVPTLNQRMFDALKPGGVLVLIDHSAAEGSPIAVTETLHRIDQAQVVRDLTAVGFVLEAESQVLRNPADNRTLRVFEGDIRGHTDQFALRFRKPG
jgi:predicted methyltransferase